MNQGRTRKSLINIVTALVGQVLAIAASFITRMVFAQKLGDTYLGINGLCTSIVGLLSLAELGVGESINYKLYKPLAENDIEQVKSLMSLYQTVYTVIGVVIMGIGCLLLPVLPMFLKASEVYEINNLNLIFFLFVLNSACSYFYSFKRALIISDQNRYVVTIYHYAFYCLMNIGQIIVLLRTKNFILYLVIMLICTVMQNVLISNKANKMYPYLKKKNAQKLKNSDVIEIKKNTLALLYHKIGSQVVNSTDNILASKIIGIAVVGIYSNYLLATTALNTIIAQLFSAITASVGNLGISVESGRSETVMKRIFFGNFWFITVVCAAFYSSIELLIKEMFGQHRVLDQSILVCIVINLYLYNIRRTVWTFRDAYGLFWYDRYKALAEALINLVISIILGFKFGLAGILIGTIVSTVSTSLWIEPYILYRYAFKKKAIPYFLLLAKYSMVTLIACCLCRYIVCSLKLHGYLGFIIGSFISVIAGSLVILLPYFRSEEFCYYRDLVYGVIKKVC